ncbi:hypothetical protein YC2023_043119 [Brassica napus]
MISSGFVRASEDSEKISSVSDFFENHKQERQHEVKTSYTCVRIESFLLGPQRQNVGLVPTVNHGRKEAQREEDCTIEARRSTSFQ